MHFGPVHWAVLFGGAPAPPPRLKGGLYVIIWLLTRRRVFCPLDILQGRCAADAGIAAGREAVGDVHGVAGPVSRVPRPEGLRQTEGEWHSDTVHPAERQEIHGGEGLAVVAPFD